MTIVGLGMTATIVPPLIGVVLRHVKATEIRAGADRR
jgi:hypothetical protein